MSKGAREGRSRTKVGHGLRTRTRNHSSLDADGALKCLAIEAAEEVEIDSRHDKPAPAKPDLPPCRMIRSNVRNQPSGRLEYPASVDRQFCTKRRCVRHWKEKELANYKEMQIGIPFAGYSYRKCRRGDWDDVGGGSGGRAENNWGSQIEKAFPAGDGRYSCSAVWFPRNSYMEFKSGCWSDHDSITHTQRIVTSALGKPGAEIRGLSSKPIGYNPEESQISTPPY